MIVKKVLLICLIFVLVTFSGQSLAAKTNSYEPANPNPFMGMENLFLNARVYTSGTTRDGFAEYAVNGNSGEYTNEYWGCSGTPAWFVIDMRKPRELTGIRMFTYWGNGRTYKYLLEGSLDKKNWKTFVDNTGNEEPAGTHGEAFQFPAETFRFVRVTFVSVRGYDSFDGYIVEIEGYGDEEDILIKKWEAVSEGLNGAIASLDERYPKYKCPDILDVKKFKTTAWIGETVNAKLLLWTKTPISSIRLQKMSLAGESTVLDGSVKASFVRYTLGSGELVPDIIDTAENVEMEAMSVRPVWVNVIIPQGTSSGLYEGAVIAVSPEGEIKFDITVEVLALNLPGPGEWKFHLDLWQNPYSVARYNGVQPWSKEHFKYMTPVYELLAAAGQKCITASIIHRPWGAQTYDPYDSMIKWIKKVDGTWAYDYSIFDRYIEYMMSVGISQYISCYSMIPWGNRFYYYDESQGKDLFFEAIPGDRVYNEHWKPFLKAFVKHLKVKGWLDITMIAMDERPHDLMIKLLNLVMENTPELKIALSISYPNMGIEKFHDVSVFLNYVYSVNRRELRERNARGQKTTFYVCCGPDKPNTHMYSKPADCAWMGLFSSALGFSGMLNWAYNSWVEEPLNDTHHYIRNWPSADCFKVYPGIRSSMRFERIREGIQVYEKIRLLREAASKSSDRKVKKALKKMNSFIRKCTLRGAVEKGTAYYVNGANEKIENLSRALIDSIE